MTLADEAEILTVSDLNRESRQLLEGNFSRIRVKGEISNLSTPSSGHVYFTLKDNKAQVRCALFRGHRQKLKFRPEHGQTVIATCNVSLYEPRGDYQLIVEALIPEGQGDLQQAFLQLKHKLHAQGWFEAEHKKPLPAWPEQIGLITSPTGAAVRDVLTVLKRRCPLLPVLIYPVIVQGGEAPASIVQAIEHANREPVCDVLILCRGGGSLEDLSAFNDERVASAMFHSHLPMVTGIGHETDFTIADFVADLRAATPSAAAEHVAPDVSAWLTQLANHRQRLVWRFEQQQRLRRQRLEHLHARLARQHPGQRLLRHAQRLDELELRLKRSLKLCMQQGRQQLAQLEGLLSAIRLSARLQHLKQQQQSLTQRMHRAYQVTGFNRRQRLAKAITGLNALSPLNVLDRGYAWVKDAETGQLIHSVRQLTPGQTVTTRLAEGEFDSQVLKLVSNPLDGVE